jgi:hypothetical protein
MKRSLIILLGLFLATSMFAHEVFMSAPIIVPDGQADEDGGWSADYVGLSWSAADDYCADFNITQVILHDDGVIGINRAWKQLKVCDFFDIRMGKDQYAFGRLTSGKPSKNLQYAGLTVADAEMMVKLLGNVSGLGWSFYYANYDAGDAAWYIYAADMGGRFTYSVAGANLGAAFMMDATSAAIVDTVTFEVSWDDPESVMNWEFDFDYTIAEKANLAFQLTNIDDDNEDTGDMNLYALLHYVPGFDIPICGKAIPYFGYITKDDVDDEGMGENNMIIGLNIKPKDSAFVKIEYNMDSAKDALGEDIDATLDLQVGFTF